MHDDRYTALDFVDDHLDDLLAFFRCHEEALAGTARQVKPMNSLVEQEADSIANSVMVEYYKKQLESANEEIATLKAMNKMLTESIKNLTAKG